MEESEQELLCEIRNASRGSASIPVSRLADWASAPSLEVRGAVVNFLRKHGDQITPPLSADETCAIFEGYYKECLVRNPADSPYVANRHVAGYELASWFRAIWVDSQMPRRCVLRIKAMLRELYLLNENLRDPIVNAVLEHLFETPEIASFFSDWRGDPELKKAYDRALEWTKRRG